MPACPGARPIAAAPQSRPAISPRHKAAALLDGWGACAETPAHRQALARADEAAKAFAASAAKVKGEFYTVCRDRAFPVPVQIVWGSEDSLTTVEHGRVLFGVV